MSNGGYNTRRLPRPGWRNNGGLRGKATAAAAVVAAVGDHAPLGHVIGIELPHFANSGQILGPMAVAWVASLAGCFLGGRMSGRLTHQDRILNDAVTRVASVVFTLALLVGYAKVSGNFNEGLLLAAGAGTLMGAALPDSPSHY